VAPALDATPEGRQRIAEALTRVIHPATVSAPLTATAIAAWLVFAAVCAFVPNSTLLPMRDAQYIDGANGFTITAALVIAAIWAALWAIASLPPFAVLPKRLRVAASRRVAHGSAWTLGAAFWLLVWVLTTAKSAIFAPPYLVAPQEILDRLWDARVLLAESTGNSLLLLAVGFLTGLLAGLATGIAIGWYQQANYWVHPILLFIGPVPPLAWVPIAFVMFPTAYLGAVFMIALSVWFPITVLTRAGILGVPKAYFDVAQTLGASTHFLIFNVSLRSALPSIFTGAFMALGASFVALTVAENFGVNSGLGWFLNWKKGWGDFPGLYAGLLVLVAVCGLLFTGLFRLRNFVLRWEKELTRW